MSKKKSIYFGIPLQELEKTVPEGDSLSGRINQAVERYQWILRKHRNTIALSDDEALAVAQALMGTHIDALTIDHLGDEMRDAEQMVGVDYIALADKLDAASFADKIALIESLKQ